MTITVNLRIDFPALTSYLQYQESQAQASIDKLTKELAASNAMQKKSQTELQSAVDNVQKLK